MTITDWFTNFERFFTFFFSVPFCVQLICAALDAVFCLGHLHFQKKYIIHKLISFVSLFFIMLFLCAASSSFAQANQVLTPYLIVFSIIISGVVYLILFEHSDFKHRFIKILLYASSAYVVTEIGHQVNLLSFSLPTPVALLVRSLPQLLMLITGLIVGIFNINRYHEITKSSLSLSIITFFALFIITLTSSKISLDMSDSGDRFIAITLALTLVFFLFTELGIYIVLYQNQRRQEEMLILQAQAKLKDAAYTMLKLNQESIERTSIVRHDLKNHYAYLKNLIEENKIDDALKYISTVNEDGLGDFHIIDCGNPVISSIMNLELSKSRIKDIPLKYLLAVPSELPFKETDLCSLITNLVDNALESYPLENKHGEVDVRMFIQDSYFRICVSNPTDKESLNLKTKKKETGHGYGIRIIKGITKNYNGYVKFDIQDHLFIADAMLDMESIGGNNHADDWND